MSTELFDPTRRYQAPAGAHLSYNGGPLLSSVKLVGVFVNELDGSPYALRADVDAFLAWFGGSSVIKALAEYDESGDVLEAGSYAGAFDVSLGDNAPPPPPPGPGGDCTAELEALLACLGFSKSRNLTEHLIRAAAKHGKRHHSQHGLASKSLTDQDVQNLLEANLANLPAPDPNTLYVMLFPTGVSITVGSDGSCTTFCGYHSSFQDAQGNTIRYAVHPFPDCAGCLGGVSALDSLTAIITHEIAEAQTDAAADASGWYDQTNGEIGDICAWQFKQVDGHNVQLLFSNKAGDCI